MYSFGSSISVFNCIDILEELKEYITSCSDECILDVTELVDIDAAGLQLLVSLKKYCDKQALAFEMVGIQEEVEATLRKLGLETMLAKETV